MYSATITYTNGVVKTIPLVIGYSKHDPTKILTVELIDRNPGRPDNWGQPWQPEPKFVSALSAKAPGNFIIPPTFGCQDNGLNNEGEREWDILTPESYKHKAQRNSVTIPGYEHCTQGLTIDGGATLYVRWVPEDDPEELEYLEESIEGRDMNPIGMILNFDPTLINNRPFLKKVIGWNSLSPYGPSAIAGQRNAGWLLVPENFIAKYPFNPTPLEGIRNIYGFGTRAAGAESLSNERYYHAANAFLNAVTTGDVGSALMGIWLVRWKIAYGIIDCDQNLWMRGMARNEKSTELRGCSGMAPSPAKSHFKDLAIAYYLFPQDQLISRGFQVTSEYLLRPQRAWNGGGGARNLSHYLENLWYYYKATGNNNFKVRAENEINFAFTNFIKDNPWFPNVTSGSTNEMCHEEGLLYWLAKWMHDEGICLQHLGRVQNILKHVLDYCVHSSGQFGYKWNPTGNPGTAASEIYLRPLASHECVYSGKFQGIWMIPLKKYAVAWDLPQIYQDKLDKIEDFCMTIYQNIPQVDACYSAEGPGWEKIRGIIPFAANA